MLLSDGDIRWVIEREEIGVWPWDDEYLQPASLDVRLHPLLRVPKLNVTRIDLGNVPEGHTELCEIDENDGYVLGPGAFVLASTLEQFEIGPKYVARVEGKSSLARLGLTVHVTAGFVDPGFAGHITLEIVNLGPWEIVLRRGAAIAQVAFET